MSFAGALCSVLLVGIFLMYPLPLFIRLSSKMFLIVHEYAVPKHSLICIGETFEWRLGALRGLRS